MQNLPSISQVFPWPYHGSASLAHQLGQGLGRSDVNARCEAMGKEAFAEAAQHFTLHMLHDHFLRHANDYLATGIAFGGLHVHVAFVHGYAAAAAERARSLVITQQAIASGSK